MKNLETFGKNGKYSNICKNTEKDFFFFFDLNFKVSEINLLYNSFLFYVCHFV